jgi:hypothetical protein
MLPFIAFSVDSGAAFNYIPRFDFQKTHFVEITAGIAL